jgi:serine/threonine-protein phosphatase 2A activator
MIKMYNAEVLSKFPVVQHFPFGSLFSWEQDPNATPAVHSFHTANHSGSQSTASNTPTPNPLSQEGTKAPWAQASSANMAPTTAPWASHPPGGNMTPTAAPWAKPPSDVPPTGMPPTRVQWTNRTSPGTGQVPVRAAPRNGTSDGLARAPWADQGSSGRR